MTRRRARMAAVAGLAVTLAVAGCGADPAGGAAGPDGAARPDGAAGPDGAARAAPLAACDGLTTAPPDAGTAPLDAGTAPPADTDAVPALPELTLPCLTGGEPFPLADLRGPAVVNLWASWCAPCREELPVLQRYADRARDRVHVVGVVTEDRREAAVALAGELGVTFPSLADREGRLRAALPATGLPVTLFVDAAGRIRHRHVSGALDQETLAGLVAEQLGVVVR